MKTNLRNQKGFTLIELVVVMVILALLAAVAVPKFLDLQKQAEAASVKKVIGNLKSALSLRVAQALVDGESLTSVIATIAPIGVMDSLLSNKPESYIGLKTTTELEGGEWCDWNNTAAGGGHSWVAYKPKNTDIFTGGYTDGSIILNVVTITDAVTGDVVGLELTPTDTWDYTWNY